MDREIVVYTQWSITRATGDTGFEGKWIQLEDITLSEISQDQKHKRHIFPSHT
jgi:hypothetical protein